jgi:antitoxin YefM
MIQANFNEFSKSINFYVDKLINNSEVLVVNTENENGFVIMSIAEYNSLSATTYELKNKKNEERLNSAIDNINKGLIFEKELILDEI